MVGIPITRQKVSEAHADRIRQNIQQVTSLPSGEIPSRLAQLEDAAELCAFLSDPRIHAPIYSLPRPLTDDSVKSFIADHLEQRFRGEGLLFVRPDEAGAIMGYSDIQVWPQWGAGELGGAIRPDRQGQRAGITGAAVSFSWMFEALELSLICETAALDNVRIAKLLDHLGFQRMGEVTSHLADGGLRQSLVWEVARDEWAPPKL